MKQEIFLRDLISAVSNVLDDEYDKHMGIALIIFDFDGDQTDYICNAKRKEMIKALRETADRIEKNETIPATIGSA